MTIGTVRPLGRFILEGNKGTRRQKDEGPTGKRVTVYEGTKSED